MGKWCYQRGLHDLGPGLFAYLQPDGGWGWSNAGLIRDGDRALLVDTLFDNRLTAEMLAAMRRAVPGLAIDTVVNTHANGDHCWGNQLFPDAEIIASSAAAAEMRETTPELVARLMAAARILARMGPARGVAARMLGALGAGQIADVAQAAPFLLRIFGAFDFSTVEMTYPTRTFDDRLDVHVGDKRVELVCVGPAHTRGDVLVHVPGDRVVFTGDILFIDGHPVIWEGPVSGWIAACRRILDMDVEAIVPGHGPITDKAGVRRLMDHLEWLEREVRGRYEAGMSASDAVAELAPTAAETWPGWHGAERLAVNVRTIYRELAGDPHVPSVTSLFAEMARLSAPGTAKTSRI